LSPVNVNVTSPFELSTEYVKPYPFGIMLPAVALVTESFFGTFSQGLFVEFLKNQENIIKIFIFPVGP